MSGLIGDSWIPISALHSICCDSSYDVASENLHQALKRERKQGKWRFSIIMKIVSMTPLKVSVVSAIEVFTFILITGLSFKKNEEPEASEDKELAQDHMAVTAGLGFLPGVWLQSGSCATAHVSSQQFA